MNNCIINGKIYHLEHNVRDNPSVRAAFFALAQKIFNLNFAPWFSGGYWGARYLPYTLFDGKNAVSNVSVNLMDTIFEGRARRYIQIGTVMTDPAYRKRGLCRFLMELVLQQWRGQCDAIYLFANDNARGFYPKFGFSAAEEWMHRRTIVRRETQVRRLDMDDSADLALFLRLYAEGNPYSAFPMLDNRDLLMFYCAQSLKRQVFFIEDCGVAAVAEPMDGELLCYDVYGKAKRPLNDTLSALLPPNLYTAALGFTPADGEADDIRPYHADDTTLFILGENLPAKHRLIFPLLSHT